MNILLLGPECLPIRSFLSARGHVVTKKEEPITREWCGRQEFNFGISYRYKHIIKKPEIDWFSGKLINLHIAYLPWNRGADPNLWSFLTQTPSGVSIHLIDEGIDTGSILFRERVMHDLRKDTLRSSYDKLNLHVVELFLKNCDAILSGVISPFAVQGEGSFHRTKDKAPFLHLLEKRGWDTPLAEILGKSLGKS